MNKLKIFVKHHLGLGDAIVHNGMIRKIFKDNNCDIFLATKYHNLDNVKFMYKDENKIHVIGVNNDYEMDRHISENEYDEIISTHFHTGKLNYGVDFDDSFYHIVDMDPNVKRDFFYLERDLNKESEIYDDLITKNNYKKYIIIHEKPNEGILVDREKIRKDLPIVFLDPKYKMFELLKTIENAEECHIISSSFLSLFTCKKYNNKVYAHMYADRIELKDYILKNNIDIII